MQYTYLGRTGVQVSRLCLGAMTYGTPKWRAWVLDEEASRPIIRRALEAGINFFDTADVYSRGLSEEILGRAIRDFSRREDVILATKLGLPMGEGPNQTGLSRKHIMDSAHASLKRLGTDYIDLYQIHRLDRNTPIEEILSALNDLVRQGKVRYLGASSMYAWEFARALYVADRHGWTRFATMQHHYNLVYREEERETIPLCLAEGIGLVPWSPLARGFLAGNRTRAKADETPRSRTDEIAHHYYYQDNDFAIVERVISLAREMGVTPAQIALAYVLQSPGVAAPIIGASKMEHLEQALGALDLHLTPDQVKYLEELYQPHPLEWGGAPKKEQKPAPEAR